METVGFVMAKSRAMQRVMQVIARPRTRSPLGARPAERQASSGRASQLSGTQEEREENAKSRAGGGTSVVLT